MSHRLWYWCHSVVHNPQLIWKDRKTKRMKNNLDSVQSDSRHARWFPREFFPFFFFISFFRVYFFICIIFFFLYSYKRVNIPRVHADKVYRGCPTSFRVYIHWMIEEEYNNGIQKKYIQREKKKKEDEVKPHHWIHQLHIYNKCWSQQVCH